MKANVITDVGKAYLQSSLIDNTPLKVINIKVGSGKIPSASDAEKLTDLVNYKKTLGVITAIKEGNDIIIQTPLNNLGVEAGFPLTEVGIYVLNEDLTETLFWYINYDEESNFINSEDLGVIRIDLSYRLVFANENITVVNANDLDTFITDKVLENKPNFKNGITIGENSEVSIDYKNGLMNFSINGVPFPTTQKFKHRIWRDENNTDPAIESNYNLKIIPERSDIGQDELNMFKLLDIYPFNRIGRCIIDRYDGTVLSFFEDHTTDLDKFGFDPTIHELGVYIPSFYANRFWDGDVKNCELLYNVVPDVRYYKGLEVPPAFIDVDGSIMPYIVYGSFMGSDDNGQLRSIPNVEPATSITIDTARSMVRKDRDIRFNLETIDDISVIQFLYEVAFQNLNSQNILGDGWTNKSAKSNTGGTLTLGNRSGCLVNGNQISLFGIEDFYGNVWSFVDGAVVKDNGIFYTMNPNDYGFNGDRYNEHIVFTPPMGANSGEQQNGYVKNIQKIDGFINYPREVNGSSTTYYSDHHWSHKRGQSNIFLFGTYWGNGSNSGCFSWHCVWVFSDAYSNVGGRLVFKPRFIDKVEIGRSNIVYDHTRKTLNFVFNEEV